MDERSNDEKNEEALKKETKHKQELQQDQPNDDGDNNDVEQDAKMEEMVSDDFQGRYEDHNYIDPTKRESGHGEIKGVYKEYRQRSQSPSAPIKGISKFEDDEQVRG